jgi:hypothetical protein
MHDRRVLLLFAASLAIILGLAGKPLPASTPSFTITASNTTFAASGPSAVPWTVTSLNGYTGTVNVDDCGPVNAPEGAMLPSCGGSISPSTDTVPANGSVSGQLPLYNGAVPVAVGLNGARKGSAAGLALAGALLVGFGFSRRSRRRLALMLLALCTLAGMAGITACGGSSGPTLTAGVWPYTMSAVDINTGDRVSTTFSLTVPSGIPAP